MLVFMSFLRRGAKTDTVETGLSLSFLLTPGIVHTLAALHRARGVAWPREVVQRGSSIAARRPVAIQEAGFAHSEALLESERRQHPQSGTALGKTQRRRVKFEGQAQIAAPGDVLGTRAR